MPLPKPDKNGLLPRGVHVSNLQEIHDTFVVNAHRAQLWSGLMAFLPWLHQKDLAYPIFIAGGFISRKPTPSDIDIVHDLRHAWDYNQWRGKQLFTKYRDIIKAEYSVDYTVNLTAHNDFSAFFQYVGPKVAAMTGLDEKYNRGIIYIGSRVWLDGLTK